MHKMGMRLRLSSVVWGLCSSELRDRRSSNPAPAPFDSQPKDGSCPREAVDNDPVSAWVGDENVGGNQQHNADAQQNETIRQLPIAPWVPPGLLSEAA
jgi:hypothetical protein